MERFPLAGDVRSVHEASQEEASMLHHVEFGEGASGHTLRFGELLVQLGVVAEVLGHVCLDYYVDDKLSCVLIIVVLEIF